MARDASPRTLAAAVGVLLAAVHAVSCGASKPPETTIDARSVELRRGGSKDLARAREMRASLMQDPPPRYAGSGTKEDVLAFVKNELRVWFDRVQPRRREAEDLFWKEAGAQSDAREASKIVGEMLGMNDDLRGRLMQAGDAAIPDEWRRDEAISNVYTRAIRDASAASFVRGGLERCANAEAKLRDELVAKCRKRLADLR